MVKLEVSQRTQVEVDADICHMRSAQIISVKVCGHSHIATWCTPLVNLSKNQSTSSSFIVQMPFKITVNCIFSAYCV